MVAMQRPELQGLHAPKQNGVYLFFSVCYAGRLPHARSRPSLTSSLLTPPADTGKVSVVRVDRRTGKLVRTISGGDSRLKLTPVAPPPAHIQRTGGKERARA